MAATDTEAPVVALLRDLMSVPSTSDEEQNIAQFLSTHLRSLGYTVELQPIAPDSSRCNVYAYPGTARKTRTLLTSHMDTVPPHLPFRIDNGIIYGRGACDDKGPLAAQIVALEELRAERTINDTGDAALLFVVGEEKGGPGMLAANALNLAWEAVIFGEPTEGKMGRGHKGHFVFELVAAGVPCHSGYPERGESAIARIVEVLGELGRVEFLGSELLGATTFHCGKIRGGVAYNVLAAEASALCGIRVAAGLAEIEDLVERVVARYPAVTMKKSFSYPETLLDYEVDGLDSMPVAFGTDVPRLKGDHKKYLYGPGSILHAHGKDEQIAIAELIEAVAVYKKLVLKALET
ncbi:putative peptidase [Aspergillus heterothallicus]